MASTGGGSVAPGQGHGEGAEETSSGRVRRARTPDPETIIDVAARLFYERGYQNTTMQDLADALGIAKPTLYTHATSKLEILGRIFDRVLLEAQQVLDEAAQHADPLASLRAVIVGQTRISVAYRAYYGVFHGDQRELSTPLRRKYRTWSRQYVETLRGVISRGQGSGVFRADVDALVTAYSVIGMTNWAARWVRPKGRLTVDEVAEEFTTLLMDGLTAR